MSKPVWQSTDSRLPPGFGQDPITLAMDRSILYYRDQTPADPLFVWAVEVEPVAQDIGENRLPKASDISRAMRNAGHA